MIISSRLVSTFGDITKETLYIFSIGKSVELYGKFVSLIVPFSKALYVQASKLEVT